MSAVPQPYGIAPSRDVEIERVRTLARVLDRYGLDAVLGFVLPGVGDAIGAVLGLYIVGMAVRRGVPPVVIVRMLMNLGLDVVIGAVPVIGDLGDLAYRANQRNLALLETRPAASKARATDWLIVVAAVLGLLGLLALVAYAVAAAFRAIAG